MALGIRRGEVWYVGRFPFNDAAGSKRRPAVIIGWSTQSPGDDNVVLVVPITSFQGSDKARNGDVEITNLQAAGLSTPSWIRARRLWGADPSEIDRRTGLLGTITNAEMALVFVEIESLFAGI